MKVFRAVLVHKKGTALCEVLCGRKVTRYEPTVYEYEAHRLNAWNNVAQRVARVPFTAHLVFKHGT